MVTTDNWDDLKTKGSSGNVGDIGTIDGEWESFSEWVGLGDEWDYKEFTLDDAAKLSFNISADDAVKFTIYSLVQDKKGNYSLKSLQSSTLKLNKKTGQYSIDTKDLLLSSGSYYIGVQSTNAKKGGSADYTVSINESSVFYDRADNSDDWTNVKTVGNGASAELCRLGEINRMTSTVTIGSGDKANWVGFSDAVDYAEFSLESGAKLSFNITADDAVKFTIYSLVQDKKGNYSLKSLQSSTLKLNKATGRYSIDTKDLLLTADAGPYYIGVQSTNAKKGGNASYTITLNDSVFYTQGDNSDDWTNVKTVGNGASAELCRTGTINEHTETITIGSGDKANWVGFNDAVDYAEFSLKSGAKLSFNITADDAVKFTIYSLVQDRKGNYSLKSLQSSTLKLNKATGRYSIDTKDLLLTADAGPYYIGVQSTNAKKGGSAKYTISLNDSVFYTQGDDGYNDWLYNSKDKCFNKRLGTAGYISSNTPLQISGDDAWVGFDDEFDYYSFSVVDNMDVSFSIWAKDAVKFTVYQVVNGKVKTLQSIAVKAGETVSSKAMTLFSGGEYYLGVQSTNAKKGGNAEYSIIAPLNITIYGISNSLFEDYEEIGYDSDCGCSGNDIWEEHYDKCIPARAKAGAIKGSDGNDTVTFAPDLGRYFDGIDLGKGDDRIVVRDSNSEGEVNERWWNDEGVTISLGDGKDSLYLGRCNELECSRLLFGEGNDTLTTAAESDLEVYWGYFGDDNSGGIDFGDGNDKLIGESDSYIFTNNLDFGDGNDYMEIKAGMKLELENLDFGNGYDELVLNGTLDIYNESMYAKITGLEKLSGSGYILICDDSDEFSYEFSDEFKNLLAGTDITVVNTLFIHGFRGVEQELGDNTINGKHVDTLSSKHDDIDFWLCSENVASEVDYGFADSVDYAKFVKTSDISGLYTQAYMSHGDASDFSCLLLNSQETVIDDLSNAFMSDYYYDVSHLANGTYYLKFSVTADGACGGYIELND